MGSSVKSLLKRILYGFCHWFFGFNEWSSYWGGATKYRYRIVRIKAWNWFLVDETTGDGTVLNRMTVSPVWNWYRIWHLLTRPI